MLLSITTKIITVKTLVKVGVRHSYGESLLELFKVYVGATFSIIMHWTRTELEPDSFSIL